MNTADLVVEYLDGRLARGEITPRTFRLLESRLKTLTGVVEEVGDLDRAGLLRWMGTLHMGPSSRRAYLSTVKVFLRWCVTEGHLETDPAAGLPRVREPRRVPRALPARSVRALFAICPDRRARAIVALMVGCGLRCCEVANLDLGDWDRDDASIVVRGKAGHERRLPVPGEVETALVEYLVDRGAAAGPLVASVRPTGYGVSAAYLSTLLGAWMTEAGIKHQPYDGRSAHALRHTCASDVFEGSMDLRAVQEMLGHQSLNTTAIYLRHADLRRLRVAMEGRHYAETA